MKPTEGVALKKVVPEPTEPKQTGRNEPGGMLRLVPLEQLDPNPHQPAGRVDEAELKGLASSIRRQGLIQPISVRSVGGRFQIVAGHRRVEAYRRLRDSAEDAAERARYSNIPAYETERTEQHVAFAVLVENLQRKDLSPLEAAAALAKLKDLSPALGDAKEIAAETGLAVKRVQRLLHLSEAPAPVKEGLLGIRVGDDASVGEDGDGERAKKARLDLHGALEFQRLHEGLLREATRGLRAEEDDRRIRNAAHQVDERVSTAIANALRGGWSVPRIKTYVASALAERPAKDAAREDVAEAAAFVRRGQRLTFDLGRLAKVRPQDRAKLAEAAAPILEALGLPKPVVNVE